jgi:hypothetical protein
VSDRLISLQLYKLKFELPSAVPPARSRIPAIATALFWGGLWQLCGEQAGSEALCIRISETPLLQSMYQESKAHGVL